MVALLRCWSRCLSLRVFKIDFEQLRNQENSLEFFKVIEFFEINCFELLKFIAFFDLIFFSWGVGSDGPLKMLESTLNKILPKVEKTMILWSNTIPLSQGLFIIIICHLIFYCRIEIIVRLLFFTNLGVLGYASSHCTSFKLLSLFFPPPFA